jgi:hypothetical protein
MRLKTLSLIAASILISACGSNTDGTGGGVAGSKSGSSHKTAAVVPESVLPVNVSNAPKGPAAYAIFENLNNPQDIQNSKEKFTASTLSKKLQQPVYSSPKTVTATQSEDKQ